MRRVRRLGYRLRPRPSILLLLIPSVASRSPRLRPNGLTTRLSMYLFQLDLPHLGLTLLVHFFTTEIFAHYKPTTLRTKKLHKLVLERRSWPLQILPPPLPNGNLPGTAYYFIPDSIFSYPTLIHCHLYSCFTHYLSNRRRNSCFASEADLGQHRRLETCRKSGKEKKKHQGYDWICQTMYALTVILKSTVIS